MPFLPVLNILGIASSPALPIGLSIVGGVVLFLLAQVAMRLARAGDVSISVRRIADLNPRIVRLAIGIQNQNRLVYALHRVCFAVKEGKEWKVVAPISGDPIQRSGDPSFIRKTEEGYSFFAATGTRNEVVIECELPEAMKEICLLAYDGSGKPIYTKIDLGSTEAQSVSFRRG